MASILVVEDNDSLRDEILLLLEVAGFDGRGARNGVEGLAAAKSETPDLIVCDVMMPEMDGLELCRRMREEPSFANVPFIFLTARAAVDDRRAGMNLGADDYLTKPFRIQDLLDAIRARLRRHAALVGTADEKPETGDAEGADLLEALREAVATGAIEVHYQPIVWAHGGRLWGVEAVARWHSTRFGPVPADRFIPLAESKGLIKELGQQVMRTACRAIQTLRNQGHDIVCSVNLSPKQWEQDDVEEAVLSTLESSGLPAPALCLELTETDVMRDLDRAHQVLDRFRWLGIQIALDDFGVGFSSLSQLKRLPIDKLKLDRGFVMGVADDAESAAIATAVLEMSRALRLHVVAEGVETRAQRRWLEERNCDLLQGFLLARPMSIDRLTEMLVGNCTPGHVDQRR